MNAKAEPAWAMILPSVRERVGVCQWFRYRDYATVERSIELLRELGMRHVGLASWDLSPLVDAARAVAERTFWYSLIDLDPARAAIERFHVDENEYHLGLGRWDGTRKPAFGRMKALMCGNARPGRRDVSGAPGPVAT